MICKLPRKIVGLMAIQVVLSLATACGDDGEDSNGFELNKGPKYRAFEAASIELDVPINLLMAVAYVDSGWEMLTGQKQNHVDPESVGWGIMGLVDGRNLERAANTIVADIDDVRFELDLNVRASAALLSVTAANTLGHDYHERAALGDWRDVLAGYSGFSDVEMAISYVNAVMQTLREGAGREVSTGEILEFEGAGDAVFEQEYGS